VLGVLTGCTIGTLRICMELDQCFFCKTIFEPCGFADATLTIRGFKERFKIPECDQVYAAYRDDRCICESCYKTLPENLDPDDVFEIHYQFGLKYLHENDPAKSIAAFRKAHAIRVTPDLIGNMALAYARNGSLHTGIALLDQLAESVPAHPIVVRSLPRLHIDAGNYEHAINLIDSNARSYGFDERILMTRAEALLRLGRFEEAADVYHNGALRLAYKCCDDCGKECERKWARLTSAHPPKAPPSAGP
jgi:hypothetical protein